MILSVQIPLFMDIASNRVCLYFSLREEDWMHGPTCTG